MKEPLAMLLRSHYNKPLYRASIRISLHQYRQDEDFLE